VFSLVSPSAVSTTGGSGSLFASGKVTFSGTSAVDLRGVFAARRLYEILLRAAPSTSTDLIARFITGTTVNSDTDHRGGYVLQSATTNTLAEGGISSPTTRFYLGPCTVNTNAFTCVQMRVCDPNTSDGVKTTFIRASDNQSNIIAFINAPQKTNSASFNGIQFSPTSGTITGDVMVYQYDI
jgi:hypothetical protein